MWGRRKINITYLRRWLAPELIPDFSAEAAASGDGLVGIRVRHSCVCFFPFCVPKYLDGDSCQWKLPLERL